MSSVRFHTLHVSMSILFFSELAHTKFFETHNKIMTVLYILPVTACCKTAVCTINLKRCVRWRTQDFIFLAYGIIFDIDFS